MTRFSSRLARIEEAVIPRRTVSVVLESLSKDELQAVNIENIKSALKEARAKRDKAFAADLKLFLKQEQAKLPAPDSHAAKLERTKRTKRLLADLQQANDDGPSHLSEDPSTWVRRHIKEQAADIRFAQRFPNLLNRLESGDIIEFADKNAMPIAMCKMLPKDPQSYWRSVEMISGYALNKREYVDLRSCNKNEIWRPWQKYCQLAEDIKDGKVQPPAPVAVKPSAPKPVDEPYITRPARPEPSHFESDGTVIQFPSGGMKVHEYQKVMRAELEERIRKQREERR
jgi:hypothetical protein